MDSILVVIGTATGVLACMGLLLMAIDWLNDHYGPKSVPIMFGLASVISFVLLETLKK